MKDKYNDFECHECKGKGSIDITYTVNGIEAGKSTSTCASCKGTGKVDWIKHAMKINKTLEFINKTHFNNSPPDLPIFKKTEQKKRVRN